LKRVEGNLSLSRFENQNIKNVSCEQGDVGSLFYADNSFDAVLSMNGFHVFPEKEKAFSDIIFQDNSVLIR